MKSEPWRPLTLSSPLRCSWRRCYLLCSYRASRCTAHTCCGSTRCPLRSPRSAWPCSGCSGSHRPPRSTRWDTRSGSNQDRLSRLLRSCLYFFLSCLFFHTVVVLYGAPLIESALETFSLAVLLTSLTTLRCLCVLGPNVQAWIRVFSRHGAMSVWDTCLQITVACTLVGAWVGAFPIPLDWDRPWQVWPVSCSLGSLFGYLTGLVAAPAWIHYHRKQLTYKCK
uniref:Phosphatidylinositol glycan anchor biosynthesis, class F n=1 Tax=Astatotilapia calliptera TaxID=8154 RepID=A0A3P8NDN5_ASTCA